MRRLAPWFALSVMLAAVTVVVLAGSGESSIAGGSTFTQAVEVVAGAALIVAAAAPGHGRSGRWLAASGALWLAAEWANPSAPGPVVFSMGLLVAGAYLPLLLVGLLDLRNRVAISAAVLAATAAALSGPLTAVFVDPQSAGCPDCPRDLASVAADPGLGLVLQTWAARLTTVACLLAAAALAVSRRHRDRDIKPPGLVTVLLVAAESVYVLREGVGSQAGVVVHALLGGALLAVAVSWWLPAFRARRALRDVVRATVGWGDGDEPADVETTLRTALADPTLRVAYLIDGQWLDARGTPVALPELGHTLVTDDDEPIAAVIPGGVRTADDGLLEAALEGVRLGLDAERILAVESRRVAVLEAARITAAEAAETARLRLERDLHDGAQQRIVSLRFALGVARSRAERERATALVTVVDEADQAGARALDQVRELAHGLGPAAVESLGLVEALRGAADDVGAMFISSGSRASAVPRVVARVAYAVVVDATRRTAVTSVAVEQDDHDVVVRLRGDVLPPAPGSLLADRVSVLGGTLGCRDMGSERELVVVIPCG